MINMLTVKEFTEKSQQILPQTPKNNKVFILFLKINFLYNIQFIALHGTQQL